MAVSTLGLSLGSEASGRILHHLQGRDGWTQVDAYHALYWVYSAMGIVNLVFTLTLSDACELQLTEKRYAEVPQEDDSDNEELSPTQHQHSNPDLSTSKEDQGKETHKIFSWLFGNISQISGPTRSIMAKLWILLALDSVADGMVPYSLTNYYMDIKFHPSKSTLGDVTSVSYLLGAVGAVFAGPLARKIGLINTMVFTHVPSSAAVLVFSLPPYFWMAAGLLFLRTALNNMDQAPRSAFIAAVVRPEERTAIMGITTMVRILAAMLGPLFTGSLAANKKFWITFILAGSCRLIYDFGLYALFVNIRLHEHESKPESRKAIRRDEEEIPAEYVELQRTAT